MIIESGPVTEVNVPVKVTVAVSPDPATSEAVVAEIDNVDPA
jgi:hypothetical protein